MQVLLEAGHPIPPDFEGNALLHKEHATFLPARWEGTPPPVYRADPQGLGGAWDAGGEEGGTVPGIDTPDAGGGWRAAGAVHGAAHRTTLGVGGEASDDASEAGEGPAWEAAGGGSGGNGAWVGAASPLLKIKPLGLFMLR